MLSLLCISWHCSSGRVFPEVLPRWLQKSLLSTCALLRSRGRVAHTWKLATLRYRVFLQCWTRFSFPLFQLCRVASLLHGRWSTSQVQVNPTRWHHLATHSWSITGMARLQEKTEARRNRSTTRLSSVMMAVKWTLKCSVKTSTLHTLSAAQLATRANTVQQHICLPLFNAL